MTARKQSVLWKISSGTSILLFAMAFGIYADAGEKSKPAHNQESKPTIEGPSCDREPNCVDAGSYIATAGDVWPSVTPKSRQIRLILSFTNVSEQQIILAYRAHSMFVLDDFGNRYFCCQSDTASDSSAVGIGIDQGNKVDPQFILKPHETAIASFDLWTPRVNPAASYYDIDVMIDEIDPTDQNTVQKHAYLPFRNVRPTIRQHSQH